VDDAEIALVTAARRVAEELLAPNAAAVDAGRVPRSHLDALAAAGVLGMRAPRSAGGVDAGPGAVREVEEVLAGADLTTWFVQAQHHSPVRAVAEAGGFDGLLSELASGRRVAGIAFSHLRRWPDRPVTASRDGDGWRLDGRAPWYTGWGINDVALVAGADPDDEVVFALLAARTGPGLSASEPMRTAALAGAVTVTLTLDGYRVPAADVVSVQAGPAWRAADADRTANVQPAVFGLTAAALALLDRRGAERGEPAARQAAARLSERMAEVRQRAYRLLDDVPPGERRPQRLALRAQAQQVMTDATTALVISGAGGSLADGAPAQRLAREALFLLVQAQTADSRRQALLRWAAGRDEPG
jgi:alkylation response protein AidB-like acyl-CoA dehydrogenase